jgi:hypothetical protein
MTGNLQIDGQDTYSSFRVLVAQNGYRELLAFPPLKGIESNDWAEEDGKEFDLSAPVLDARELTIHFTFHGEAANFEAFIERLSDVAYHDFNFTEIGKTYRLRLVSQPDMTQISTLGKSSLRFADDFPLRNYTYYAPQSNIAAQDDYKIDDRRFSDYGVTVLRGAEAEIKKSPAVKKNLSQDMKGQNGVIYDGAQVKFQAKEVKLNCLMRANSMSEFWRNYEALLYDLARPNERQLYADSTKEKYPCYYKSCSAINFVPKRKIWAEFSLTFVFTSFSVASPPFYFISPTNYSVAPKWTAAGSIQYSIDGGISWKEATSGIAINVPGGVKLLMRGKMPNRQLFMGVSAANGWVLSGSNIEAHGNIMKLLNYSNPPDYPNDNAFACMFYNCTKLIKAPELPATILRAGCYNQMFYGCTGLEEPPALPATIIESMAYRFMFLGCTKLKYPPALPSIGIPSRCYEGMCSGCTSIKLATTPGDGYDVPYRIPAAGIGSFGSGTNHVTSMFTVTGGTWQGTPNLNTTYYLKAA